MKLNGYEKSVYLKKEDMMLDLGAIAKGYASDEVVRILKEASVSRAIINLGGMFMLMEKRQMGPLGESVFKIRFQREGNTLA